MEDEGHERARGRSRASSVLHERPLQAPPSAALPPVPNASSHSITANANTNSNTITTNGNRNSHGMTNGRSEGKASLSEALAQAQVAVQLDQTGDTPRAIDAYTNSVQLLEQVMARVDAGSAKDRARVLPANLPIEKLERIQKRQQARQDEARRLKVIVRSFPGSKPSQAKPLMDLDSTTLM